MNGPRSRVVATGDAGFIGSELVRLLVRDGAGVTVVDNLANGRRKNLGACTKNDANFRV